MSIFDGYADDLALHAPHVMAAMLTISQRKAMSATPRYDAVARGNLDFTTLAHELEIEVAMLKEENRLLGINLDNALAELMNVYGIKPAKTVHRKDTSEGK